MQVEQIWRVYKRARGARMHREQEIRLLLRGIQMRLSSLGGSSLKSKEKPDNSRRRKAEGQVREKANRNRKYRGNCRNGSINTISHYPERACEANKAEKSHYLWHRPALQSGAVFPAQVPFPQRLLCFPPSNTIFLLLSLPGLMLAFLRG